MTTDWQSLTSDDLAAAISRTLKRNVPRRAAQRALAPELAYGRHHGPIPATARRAAVLLALELTPQGWSLPALVRPTTMKSHGGQVSLPGGLIEPGETPIEAALREFEEELGASPAELMILGTLSPIYVFISNFAITPVLALAPQPLDYRPSPAEVAEVLELPLADLMNPALRGSHLVRRRELAFRAPHLALAGKQIWGATSVILAELADLLTEALAPPAA
jgi:8-oxo-dGTP pyrophosphatase MutT (NUDIX family)